MIWYHLHRLKNVKNSHGGVIFLVKLQVLGNTSLQLTKSLNCHQPQIQILAEYEKLMSAKIKTCEYLSLKSKAP